MKKYHNFKIGDTVLYCGDSEELKGSIGTVVKCPKNRESMSCEEFPRVWVKWDLWDEPLEPVTYIVRKLTKLDKVLK